MTAATKLRVPVRRLGELDESALDAACIRGNTNHPEVRDAAAAIIADVRARGDAALADLAERFDDVQRTEWAIEVPRDRWEEALAALDPAVREALESAAESIRAFHDPQRPVPMELEPRPGLTLGRRPDPLRRVGVYAPGGSAAYPSSVLMGVVPARAAGVEEVVVCSPPSGELPSPLVMAACAIGGADRLMAVGGAGAVAALAYGTETVPVVDRIVGPGNAWVAEAKRQVSAVVGIDSPAGPSEILVVADETADVATVVRELLAQAEHDPEAAAILVTTDPALGRAVAARLPEAAGREPREEIIVRSLASAGGVYLADSEAEALAFAERYAPEHLLLLVADPRAALDRVRCAGTVFLGPRSSVALGDYVTGANHTLPTGGAARSYSGLSVTDFVRWTTWQEVRDEVAADLAARAGVLARAEGLPAHAAAAHAAADRLTARPDERAGLEAPTAPRPRQPYRDMTRYAPTRPPVELDLSANTSLAGPPPAAAGVMAGAVSDSTAMTGYPTPYAEDLKRALAARWDVDTGNVVTGCGSDDVIDSAMRAFCEPGATVAFPAPTFPMAETFARMNDARPVPVPMGPAGELEDGAIARLCDADVVYLCRPNNPTGAMPDRSVVGEILVRARGLVLIDEAYGEFAGESMLADALSSDRGLVLRTLSKAYGLAGLRVGYGLGPTPVVRAIELSRGPYKVGALAERAAVAALEDRAWVERVVADTVSSRDRLAGELRERGLDPLPSAANFLLVPCADPAALAAALAEREISVRVFDDLEGVGSAFRVTAGPWPRMERFLDGLDAALDGLGRAGPSRARRRAGRPRR